MAARRKPWSYILPPALALGLVLLLRLSLLTVVRVHSTALSPEIRPGAVAFVWHGAELGVGQAVLLRLEGEVAEGGLALGRICRVDVDSLGRACYWVLADDTLQHPDSRHLGWIARPDIVGGVVYHVHFLP